jgi:hypothetical protein
MLTKRLSSSEKLSDHSPQAKRIDATTWGLLLLMTGILLLLPSRTVPEGAWLPFSPSSSSCSGRASCSVHGSNIAKPEAARWQYYRRIEWLVADSVGVAEGHPLSFLNNRIELRLLQR